MACVNRMFEKHEIDWSKKYKEVEYVLHIYYIRIMWKIIGIFVIID